MEAVPIQSENFKLGFIGAGKMAESIARGVVQSSALPPQRISTAIHSNPSRGTAFQSLGISVYSHNIDMHAEAGNGQYEMALGYTACTYAADNLIFMREVVRAIANKHGLLATFVPNYDRIQPNTCSGAYQCWGKENREAHCIFFYLAMCIVIGRFN
uniref:Pyrroline-5-carboxylate reductase catalytic N-terminal domain-containing protein n=1 Tax=Gossypium raimondii TaxID=29730 RepID=A0A0D2T0U3_GOSRA|nr:hypothetical protein B456_008G052500 [Gossypium raimondii]